MKAVLRQKKADEDKAKKQAEEAAESARVTTTIRPNTKSEHDIDDNSALNCEILNDFTVMTLRRRPDPEMHVIREALIATTKTLFLADKLGLRASTVRRQVRAQLQLRKGFFDQNGWPRRTDIIIMEAYREARVSLLPGGTVRSEFKRHGWTTVN